MNQSGHPTLSDEEGGGDERERLELRKKNPKLTEQYYLYMMSYIEMRPVPVYAKQLLRHFQILHAVIVYLLLSEQPLSAAVRRGMGWAADSQGIYRFVQLLVYFIDLASIILIILLHSHMLFPSTKTKIAKLTVQNVPLGADLALFLSSYLMLFSIAENSVVFLASLGLYFYCNIMMINDTNRRGVAFITSSMHNLQFCAIFTLFYTSNCISLASQSQIVHEVCLTLGALSYLLWFRAHGHKIYLSPLLQKSLNLFISLTLVIVVQIIELKLVNSQFLAENSIAAILMTSVIVGGSIKKFGESRFERSYHSFESNLLNSEKLKQFQLFLWSYQKEQREDIQTKSYLKGLMKEIADLKVEMNDDFGVFTTRQSLYRNNDGQEDTATRPFDEVLLNYIHAQYEKILSTELKSQAILNYIDFMLNTSGNFFRLHILIERLRHMKMGVLDKLKFMKVSFILKKNIEKFNNQVYEHFDLDQIMECEDTYRHILTGINAVINHNIDIWRKVSSKTIEQSLIERNLIRVHETIENIDELWLRLTAFLKLNKKWLFIYLVYCLYIKNERIKSELLAEVKEEDAFLEQKSLGKSEIFNLNTFYLRCRMTNDQMRVLKISSNTSNLIDYTEEEMIGTQLDLILPQEIRSNHNQKVIGWLVKGQCNREKSYRTINSHLINKNQQKIAAKIIFTLHIDYSSEYNFQFVALLNVKMRALGDEEDGCKGASPADSLMKIDKRGDVVLDNRNNIFLKEKNLKPIKTHTEVSFVKLILGVLILFLLVVNFVSIVHTQLDLTDLQSNVLSYFNFLNLYRFPMSIGKNYMKSFLNLGNQTKVASQISLVYSQIIAFSVDPFTIQTIFDPEINVPAIYYPYSNNSFNLGIGLNQIDIFYEILSNLAALSKAPIQINRNGYEFTQFNMYIKPAFDIMINRTKLKLNEKLGDIIVANSDDQFIFGGIQILLILIVLLIITVSIYRFLRHMEGVMKIIFDLEEGSVKKVAQYWYQFQVFFRNIKVESQNYERAVKKARKTQFVQTKQEYYSTSNMNRREKQIRISKNHKKKTLIFYLVMLLLFAGILAFSVIIELYSYSNFKTLNKFYDAGFYFLQFYPTTSTLGHATLEKYYSVLYPQEVTFHPERFQDTIDALFVMGNTSYIGEIAEDSSPYYQKQKHYLFSNPCDYDPSVMVAAQVTMAQCRTYNNKSFTSGIISYIRNIQNPLANYLSGRTNMSYSQLDELTASLSLVTYYITDIIKTWSYEFVDRISVFRSNLMIVVGSCSGIVVVLYLVILVVVKKTLESSYSGVVYMLSYMMPESILLKEKITRQKLVELSILRA